MNNETKWNVFRKRDDRYMGQMWAHHAAAAVRGYCMDRELSDTADQYYYALAA